MNELLPDALKQHLDRLEPKSPWWRIGGRLMVRLAATFVGVLSLLTVTSNSALALKATCFSSKDGASLSCPLLGLELWEEGKRAETIFQQWNLTCEATDRKRCWLDRTLIAIWPENMGGTHVSVHHHSTTEGTLRLLDPNWDEGRLEFEIVYPNGQRMPVLMRLKRLSPDSGLLYVESFQAKDVVRTLIVDRLVSQEWRIPEYTYTVKTEMVMPGKKSADERARDEMLNRLSSSDRAIFERSTGRCLDFGDELLKEPSVARVLSRYEARVREIEKKIERAKDREERLDLFGQQNALMKEIYSRSDVRNAITSKLDKCLANAGMSPDGRRAVMEGLLATVFRALAEGR